MIHAAERRVPIGAAWRTLPQPLDHKARVSQQRRVHDSRAPEWVRGYFISGATTDYSRIDHPTLPIRHALPKPRTSSSFYAMGKQASINSPTSGANGSPPEHSCYLAAPLGCSGFCTLTHLF